MMSLSSCQAQASRAAAAELGEFLYPITTSWQEQTGRDSFNCRL